MIRDISEALIIEGSGFGDPYTVRLSRVLNNGTCTGIVETPGNGQTYIIFDTDTGEVTSAAWSGHKVVNDPHGFSVEFPESDFDRELREAAEEDYQRNKAEAEAMEASPLWGAW